MTRESAQSAGPSVGRDRASEIATRKWSAALFTLAAMILVAPAWPADPGTSGSWLACAQLKGEGSSARARPPYRPGFGHSVDVLGDRLAVGAVTEGGWEVGAVYMYERRRPGCEGWELAATLTIDDRPVNNLGRGVSLDGDRLLAVADDSAWVFELDPDVGQWDQGTQLEGGLRVGAMSGDTVAVQAAGDSVLVWVRQARHEWAQVATLEDAQEDTDFGDALAVDADTLVVGAPRAGECCDRGTAYVYERRLGGEDAWGLAAELTSEDPLVAYANFGDSVAIDGNRIVVGAPGQSVRDFHDGELLVFERDPANPLAWRQVGAAPNPLTEDHHFGVTAALDGDIAVVAANSRYDFGRPDRAHLIARAGGAWDLSLALEPEAWFGDFALGLAVDGETIAVGQPGADLVYLFETGPCAVELTLDPPRARPGETLQVHLVLRHHRLTTVTVPVKVWVEDPAGEVVAQLRGPEQTFHFGETLTLRLPLALPEDMSPGPYRVLVGIEQMGQGLAVAAAALEVMP